MAEGIMEIDDGNFEHEVLKADKPVMVDFWAPWCGPCKTLAPRIRQLSKSYKGKVAFGKINIDNYHEIAKRFHIMSIPNLTLFSYGEKITNIVGVKPINEIQEIIEETLGRFEN